MTSGKVVCGFCHKGGEESSTSGRLYSHESIHAHLRCMQYSSGLAQYQKGRYPQLGGFKWSQVKDEMKRGSHLKCHVCGKRKGSMRGATAGCTIRKCPKTFHFTCAALDKAAITKRIVVHSAGEDEKVFYRVFCGKTHFQSYEKQELKKLGAFEYQSDSEDDDDDDDDDESGTSDPQSSNSKDTTKKQKKGRNLSVVGTIYPRIANLAQETDSGSEASSGEVVFNLNPNRITVTAEVHSQPDLSQDDDDIGTLSDSFVSAASRVSDSRVNACKSPTCSPILNTSTRKSPRCLSPVAKTTAISCSKTPVSLRASRVGKSSVSPSPGAPSPGAHSPGAQSPGAQSPGAQSPGAQSPGAQSPGAQSPGAQSPASPSGSRTRNANKPSVGKSPPVSDVGQGHVRKLLLDVSKDDESKDKSKVDKSKSDKSKDEKSAGDKSTGDRSHVEKSGVCKTKVDKATVNKSPAKTSRSSMVSAAKSPKITAPSNESPAPNSATKHPAKESAKNETPATMTPPLSKLRLILQPELRATFSPAPHRSEPASIGSLELRKKASVGQQRCSTPLSVKKAVNFLDLSEAKVSLVDCLKSPLLANDLKHLNKSGNTVTLGKVSKKAAHVSATASPTLESSDASNTSDVACGSPPAKRMKGKSHDIRKDQSGCHESSSKGSSLNSSQGAPWKMRIRIKSPVHKPSPPQEPSSPDAPSAPAGPVDRNESFDLTPDSSSSQSVNGEAAVKSPIPQVVLKRSLNALHSSGSEASKVIPDSPESSGRQHYKRRAAKRSQQKWRVDMSPRSKAKTHNSQSSEDAEISKILQTLPAWQSWLHMREAEAGNRGQGLQAVCFLESPLPSHHILHRILFRTYGIDEQDMFIWQPPDSLQLSDQHMLHIMKDITFYMQTGEISEVQRLMLNLDESDIRKYTKQIQFDERYIYTDIETKQKFQSNMWSAVSDCLRESCDKMGVIGGIVSVSDVHVLILVLNHTLDPLGDIYKSMLNSQLDQVSLFNFGKDNTDWLVNLRSRHTQEMYMEQEQRTICQWLLAHLDSCSEVLLHPVDELMRQEQLSVNSYLQEQLPKRLAGSRTTKPSSVVVLVGPVNLEIVQVSPYCQRLISKMLDFYHEVPHVFFVLDFGELEGSMIRRAVIPDQLPDDVSHCIWLAGDPKVLPVSCLIVQLTRKSRLPLTSSSSS